MSLQNLVDLLANRCIIVFIVGIVIYKVRKTSDAIGQKINHSKLKDETFAMSILFVKIIEFVALFAIMIVHWCTNASLFELIFFNVSHCIWWQSSISNVALMIGLLSFFEIYGDNMLQIANSLTPHLYGKQITINKQSLNHAKRLHPEYFTPRIINLFHKSLKHNSRNQHHFENSRRIVFSFRITEKDLKLASEIKECVICCQEFSLHQQVMYNNCAESTSHVFHAACLREWSKEKQECPICRSVLRF